MQLELDLGRPVGAKEGELALPAPIRLEVIARMAEAILAVAARLDAESDGAEALVRPTAVSPTAAEGEVRDE